MIHQFPNLPNTNALQVWKAIKADKNLKNLEPENPLPKWLSVRLRTKWLWVRVPLQSL